MDDTKYDFELAYMVVSAQVQGKGIGWLLGEAIVERAKEKGGKKLYLESNTELEEAIQLYQKLGFRKVVGRPKHYYRYNVQMELSLN